VQVDDLLLDRVLRDETVDGDRQTLADAMCAIRRLVLNGRIPPGIEQDDVVRRGEVQSRAIGLE